MASVDQLWPPQARPADLAALYDYPPDLAAPYVRVNFVSSLDGAVTLANRSRGLSDPADRDVFALQRTMADVILVGAGTARAEGYRGMRPTDEQATTRAALGLAPVPPIAVVTASCWLTPEHPLVTDTLVPPIVVTVERAPAEHRAALADAGVPVLVAGPDRVDAAEAVRLLGERGLNRLLCEGGPHLFADLVDADLVDELCLTISPQLVGGAAGRITAGAAERSHGLRLASVVHDESTLLLRYHRS